MSYGWRTIVQLPFVQRHGTCLFMTCPATHLWVPGHQRHTLAMFASPWFSWQSALLSNLCLISNCIPPGLVISKDAVENQPIASANQFRRQMSVSPCILCNPLPHCRLQYLAIGCSGNTRFVWYLKPFRLWTSRTDSVLYYKNAPSDKRERRSKFVALLICCSSQGKPKLWLRAAQNFSR